MFKKESELEKHFRDKLKSHISLLVFPKLETHIEAVPDLICFNSKAQILIGLEFKLEPIKRDSRYIRQLIYLKDMCEFSNVYVDICTQYNWTDMYRRVTGEFLFEKLGQSHLFNDEFDRIYGKDKK